MFVMVRRFLSYLSLSTVLVLGALLAACLDVPHEPSASSKVYDVKVNVSHNGIVDYSCLKINANDTASIVATTVPSKYQDELHYDWYREGELINSGRVLPLPKILYYLIPDSLVVSDDEGNSISRKFEVIVNTPPKIDAKTRPADGDTLYGDNSTAFTFSWFTSDPDRNDGLTHILEIDGTSYQVGELEEVKQSGFEPGLHEFRIIAKDSRGDSDSLPVQTFYVVDTLEAK